MRHRPVRLWVVRAALLAGGLPLLLLATRLPAQAPLTGYSTPQAGREHALERLVIGAGDTARARAHSRALASEPHVAGTPAEQRTAEYVLRAMRGFGLDTSRADFKVYLPYPDSTVVEIVSPTPMRLTLDEPALAEDTASQGTIWPAMNGHAASGDVTAAVVFSNYGLPDDYRVLDSLGVSVRGKIVLARYGRSFRGIKAREAEARGAAALLLYSDPADDGYVQGDVYPEGPMRPPLASQRGSILIGNGDPSTPGGPSLPGVARLTPAEMTLPRIPVVPLGYANAALLLEPLRGRNVPQPWQGGLPFRYHVGDGEVTVRVGLWHQPDDESWKTITNTFGTLRGSEWPDEIVYIGGHRDAWGPGAMDNVSGCVSILEAARLLADAARQGYRPRRTIVFATWDAEEWGLMGSTEWVESREPDLVAHAVAYLNLDVSVSGRDFNAGGSGSLHPLLRELSRLVDQPYDSGSVYAAWRRRQKVADTLDVAVDDLGGGSDFAGFYNHLGIPAAGFGFGGPGGIYHSAYDSYDWMRRFGDRDFRAHVAAGELAALALSRLANADVVPFDYVAFATHLRKLAVGLGVAHGGGDVAVDPAPLLDALDSVAVAAGAFAARRDAVLASGSSRRTLTDVNAALRAVERALTRPEGLRGRPWMRNLVFASDRDNGYATIAFPAVAEALRDRDLARAAQEVADLAGRMGEAGAALTRATAALGAARAAR